MKSNLTLFYNIVILLSCSTELLAVRLHKLFQFIDGFRSEHSLDGFLHIGDEYAVYLKKPEPNDKYLIYELYEAKNGQDMKDYRPKLLAISRVPIDYIKEELKTFSAELYKAKYEDVNVVPGTQVQTVREWQIHRALNFDHKQILQDKMPVLRTLL